MWHAVQVFKVCWTKLLQHGRQFSCTCTATLEALWLVRLRFAENVPSCVSLDKDCKVVILLLSPKSHSA